MFSAKLKKLTLILLPMLISACAISQLNPWDRDLLAKESMQLVPSPVDAALDEHIYFSKEASSGGASVGGGGCGCN